MRSCHIGEAAGKAGQLLNFNVGGEGRGYIDATREVLSPSPPDGILIKLRSSPLFPGDDGGRCPPDVDRHLLHRRHSARSPRRRSSITRASQPPAGFSIVASGRLDQIDSVGRQSPGMIGFAFNNRLLFGGLGGEPHTTRSLAVVPPPQPSG